MHIILLEHVEKLGHIGDVVRVKPGYARNFLIPQGKALRANSANQEYFESQRAQLEKDNEAALTKARAMAKKINDKNFTIIRQASDGGQLYGSVNSRDIVARLAEEDCVITRRQVLLSYIIKTLGIHPAQIRFHPEVSAQIQLNVARSEEEAHSQTLTIEEEQQALKDAAEKIFDSGTVPNTILDESNSIEASSIEDSEAEHAKTESAQADNAEPAQADDSDIAPKD